MKKLFVLLASVGFSLNAMAADDSAVMFTSEDTVVNDASGCSLLSESVRMNLSSNVLGTYGCNTATAIIGVATCHTAGRKKSWEEPVWEDADSDPSTPMTQNGTTTIYGGRAYATSSVGGSMMEKNTTTCVTGGSITDIGTWASAL
jgi:hypothetical protein